MTRAIAVLDQPQPWSTLEETIEQELMLALPEDEQASAADWYQDAREYSLPRECMPGWRTLH